MNEKAYKFSTRDSTEFTVEEGSGNEDFQIFQVTLSCTDPNSDITLIAPIAFEESPVGSSAVAEMIDARDLAIPAPSAMTLPILGYKGKCVIFPISTDLGFDAQVTGDIEQADGVFVVTGDGTIMINALSNGENNNNSDPPANDVPGG